MSNKKTHYNYIDETSTAEFKDRGSKFIAFAFPLQHIDDVKKHITQLKKNHPKANHFCYAYTFGFDGLEFRTNDDGEPAGSAGKPIYNQILSKDLQNVLVVVVRYFGGTLLGVPGLINAYKTATSLALQTVPIKTKAIEVPYSIEFDYTQMNDIISLAKQYQLNILTQDIQLFCRFTIGFPLSRLEELVYTFNKLQGITLKKV